MPSLIPETNRPSTVSPIKTLTLAPPSSSSTPPPSPMTAPLQSPDFKLITDEWIQEWKSSNADFRIPDSVPMSRFLYELCWAVVRGDLPVQKCKPALESVGFCGEESREEMGSVLADTVAHMGQDLVLPGEYHTRLVKMAKWLVESSFIPSRLLQERCEEDFLWEAELTKIKAQDLKAKEVRVNTRLLYQQTKFNLVREESEGYSKLVTLLCQDGSDAMVESESSATISIIKSLIGHFDLDPNRVFDIVLECFELHPNNPVFYSLVPLFPKSHTAQILGFKFQYYQRMEVNSLVPSGLYRLAALLVKAQFYDLDTLYAHLLPRDDEAFEHYDAYLAKRFNEANKIGKINLAATGKDLMDDEKQDIAVDLFNALDMESEAVSERASEVDKNQCLGLLIGFLSVDDWCHAQILFERLSHMNPVEHVQICEGLFRLIEKSILPVSGAVCQTLEKVGTSLTSGSEVMESTAVSSTQDSAVDLPRELFQMLTAAGPYLHRDSILLQKVCRALRAYFLSSDTRSNSPELSDFRSRDPRIRAKEAKVRVEDALGTCLLPSLQLIPANPAVGQEIWELLSLLPYEARYRLYGEWEKDDEQNPMVLAARQIAKLDTRRLLKRLAKENLKQLGRMVAKLAHANPLTVLRTIVHQIEAYKDMIAPVVDAFKYLTQLEYDVLEYVVIERLAYGGREKLKDDGLNLSDWLQSLASFWGHLCKKYPSMELRGLFQYLVNQLKRGIGIELVLLQELIQQMANLQYTENMTADQVDAMAGSETLRNQVTLFEVARTNKALSKSTNRLRDSLLPREEPKLAIPLLLLIAQHRSMIIINADAPHIKMVSEQFDRCHGTMLQYVEFLSSAITPTTAYARLIPNLDDLVHKYHLDPEVAFLIYRPLMRLFRCTDGPEVFWPLDIFEESNTSNADNESETLSVTNNFVLDLDSLKKRVMWSDLHDTVRTMLPLKTWNSLSPDLYTTFWGLTLYDLYVPRNRYESEISKQHAALKALEEVSDNSNSAITKRKKEKERIQELLDRLILEYEKHEQHVPSVHRRLSHEKDNWWSTCPDTSRINMEFLQRCIFPRCIFSVPDAVYCAMFVQTLHSLGTPFFNTVNHIDVLICKTLQPMICSCTEFEAGRLGRFLYETLKMAYHWKSAESVYEHECGNKPGFAVYYRFPNSQRVTFGQFIRVHWKWSARITRLLVQCLESSEYLEIRNALIILTKVASVFPVTRKSGINLEKRVGKIKGDEREDLKVLATGVAAALAARKSSWVTDEEFGMGYLDLKPAAPPAKSLSTNLGSATNGSAFAPSQSETGARNSSVGSQAVDNLNMSKDQITRTKASDIRLERSDNTSMVKPDLPQQKTRGGSSSNGLRDQSTTAPSGVPTKPLGALTNTDEIPKAPLDVSLEGALETRPQLKRSIQTVGKPPKQDMIKDDTRSGKLIGKTTTQPSSASVDKDFTAHISESRQGVCSTNGVSASSSRMMHDMHVGVSKMDISAGIRPSENVEVHEARNISTRSSDSPLADDSFTKQSKRNSPSEQDRHGKRRKLDSDGKNNDGLEVHMSDKDRNIDLRPLDKTEIEDPNLNKQTDKFLDKPRDRSIDKHDKDQKEKLDRPEKIRSEDVQDKSRDRSMERHGRERSVDRIADRVPDRSTDRSIDKTRDERSREDRSKARHREGSMEKAHVDERFHGQSLPPPPPLPPSYVPQSVGGTRRDEELDRRVASSRHMQRLSPRHDEKERRRSEEHILASQDDAKRKREDDFRERKRDDRDGMLNKAEDRDRDKGNVVKDDMESNTLSKRRKIKRDHSSTSEAGGEYLPVVPPPPPLSGGISQPFEVRERSDRKGGILQHRTAYMDEQVPRMHGKESLSKINRRETEQIHEREWEEEKRLRAEAKRKHRK